MPNVSLFRCSCCDGEAPAREQWPNRDTGYGVCSRCFYKVAAKEGIAESIRLYGHPGRHHSIPWVVRFSRGPAGEPNGLVEIVLDADSEEVLATLCGYFQCERTQHAELIVRAVNTHQQLIGACHAALNEIEGWRDDVQAAVNAATAH